MNTSAKSFFSVYWTKCSIVQVIHFFKYGRCAEQFRFTVSINMRDAFTNYTQRGVLAHKGRKWSASRIRAAFSIRSPLYRKQRRCARSRRVRRLLCLRARGSGRSYVMCFGRILISTMAPFVWLLRHLKRTCSPATRAPRVRHSWLVWLPSWRIYSYTFDVFLTSLRTSPLLFSSHPATCM